MDMKQWEQEFRPKKNHLNPGRGYDDTLFEAFDEDKDFIYSLPADQVWTLLEEDGHLWIGSGRHFVNRLGYFYTEVPWTEDIEVPLGGPDDFEDEDVEDLSTD